MFSLLNILLNAGMSLFKPMLTTSLRDTLLVMNNLLMPLVIISRKRVNGLHDNTNNESLVEMGVFQLQWSLRRHRIDPHSVLIPISNFVINPLTTAIRFLLLWYSILFYMCD